MADPIGNLTTQDMKEGTVDIYRNKPVKRMGYNKRVECAMAEFKEKGKAFCNRCAMSDHSQYKKRMEMKRQEEIKGGRNVTPIRDFEPNFADYSKRMKKVGESQKNITSRIHGAVVHNVPVIFEDYKCEVCEGGHSLEVERKPTE